MTKRIAQVLVVVLISLFAGMALLDFGPSQNLDNIITDANIRYFAPAAKISDEIVMILLDEATMKGLPYRSETESVEPVAGNDRRGLGETIPLYNEYAQ